MRTSEQSLESIQRKQASLSVFLVGSFSDLDREEFQRAAFRAELTTHASPNLSHALTRLRAGRETPLCVLAAPNVDIKRLVDAVRDEAELFALPVLACVSHASAAAFSGAWMAGADDVLVGSDYGGLSRRLALLGQARSAVRPEATLGSALVCVDDGQARRRIGRTLRHAGFDVSFASDVREIATVTAQGSTPMFAVAVGEPPEGLDHQRVAIGSVARMSRVPVLFLEADAERGLAQSGEQIVDATGRLLFFADERVKEAFTDRRVSTRKLCATVCSFREAGSLIASYGVTYNVSGEGLYVRTLDPPRPSSALWIELQTPSSGVPIHLRATAVWQRSPGAGKGALPPGFGLSIDRPLCPPNDVREFLRGYSFLQR